MTNEKILLSVSEGKTREFHGAVTFLEKNLAKSFQEF